MARRRGARWLADTKAADGKRLRVVFETEEAARRYEEGVREAVSSGRPLPLRWGDAGAACALRTESADGPAFRLVPPLGAVFDYIVSARWGKLRSAENAICQGRVVVAHFGRDRALETITEASVAAFAEAVAARGRAPSTVRRKLAALSVLLRAAKAAGIISSVPKMPCTAPRPLPIRHLSALEEAALLAYWTTAGDPGMRDLTVLLLRTGARAFSEALPLSWDAFSPKAVALRNPSSGQTRSVPLTRDCREMLLRRRREEAGTVGPFQSLREKNVRDRWDQMRGALRFHDVPPRTMRDTFGARLAQGGIGPERIAELMGHRAPQTAGRYAHFASADFNDLLHILERAEPI